MNPLTAAFHFDHNIDNQIAGQLPVLPGYPALAGGKKKRKGRKKTKKKTRKKTRTKTKTKSKSKTKTKTKSKSRSKSRTKSRTKSRSKSRTKSRTKSRKRSKARRKNGGAPPLIALGLAKGASLASRALPFLGSGESE